MKSINTLAITEILLYSILSAHHHHRYNSHDAFFYKYYIMELYKFKQDV